MDDASGKRRTAALRAPGDWTNHLYTRSSPCYRQGPARRLRASPIGEHAKDRWTGGTTQLKTAQAGDLIQG